MKKTTISAMTLSAIFFSFGMTQSLHAEETNPDGSPVTSTATTSTASTSTPASTSVVSTSNPLNNQTSTTTAASTGSVVPVDTTAMRPTYDAAGASMSNEYLNSMTVSNPDESSRVADAYSTPQWNDENNSWGTSVVKGADKGSLAAGCDPAVSSGIMANQMKEIGGAKALAAKTITMPPEGIFSKLMENGCLPGLGGSASFPGLNQLKQLPEMLAKQACQAARSIEQNYLAQYVTNPISSFSQNANVNLGSIGGYSLGSVPMGVQLSGTAKVGQGGPPITVSSDAIQTARGLGLPNFGGTSQGLQAAQSGQGSAVHNGFYNSLSDSGSSGSSSYSSGDTTGPRSDGSTVLPGIGDSKIIKSADGTMRVALPGEL